LSLFLFTQVIANDELSWVNEQIEAIKPPRNGLNDAQLNILENPFIIEEKKTEDAVSTENNNINSNTTVQKYKKNQSLKLAMIINESAFINSKWYKLHEKIHSYTISEINYDSVVLTKKDKKRVLSTKNNLPNLKSQSK